MDVVAVKRGNPRSQQGLIEFRTERDVIQAQAPAPGFTHRILFTNLMRWCLSMISWLGVHSTNTYMAPTSLLSHGNKGLRSVLELQRVCITSILALLRLSSTVMSRQPTFYLMKI